MTAEPKRVICSRRVALLAVKEVYAGFWVNCCCRLARVSARCDCNPVRQSGKANWWCVAGTKQKLHFYIQYIIDYSNRLRICKKEWSKGLSITSLRMPLKSRSPGVLLQTFSDQERPSEPAVIAWWDCWEMDPVNLTRDTPPAQTCNHFALLPVTALMLESSLRQLFQSMWHDKICRPNNCQQRRHVKTLPRTQDAFMAF